MENIDDSNPIDMLERCREWFYKHHPTAVLPGTKDMAPATLRAAITKFSLQHSRQLLAASEAETTRLLAAKFVADEAVGLVGELVEALEFALGKLDKARDEYADATDLHLPCWTVEARSKILRALTKAAQFTAAGTEPTVGGASEPVIFPPGEVEAVPEYVPYWPMIPERFDHVAVDKDRMVFAYIGRPKQRHGCEWWPESEAEEDFTYLAEILTPVGETWQKMVYKRPE